VVLTAVAALATAASRVAQPRLGRAALPSGRLFGPGQRCYQAEPATTATASTATSSLRRTSHPAETLQASLLMIPDQASRSLRTVLEWRVARWPRLARSTQLETICRKARAAVKAAPKPVAGSLSEQVAMLKAASAALGKEEVKRIIDLL
jgi:hypothetical protein